MRQKPEDAQSIVERDDDDALLGETRTVMSFLTTEARIVATAVDPDHHGTLGAGAERRGPDVQIETILGDSGGEWIDVAVDLSLHAVLAEPIGRAHGGPVRRGHRSAPPQIADRRSRVRYTTKHSDACR